MTSRSPVQNSRRQSEREFWLRRLGSGLITLETVLGFLFIYIPIIILIIFSFNASRFTNVWSGFTLDWYTSLLQGGGVLGLGGVGGPSASGEGLQAAGILFSLRNSMIVAAISTVLSTALGTTAAIAMERFRFRLRGFMDVMLYLPIVIPEIAMGISLAVFFNTIFGWVQDLTNTLPTLGFATIIIGHVAFNISFVAIVVRARLAGMDKSLEEAAQDSGANEWQTFTKIVLPLIAPGIVGGALLAFTLSLDDFVITFYTSGTGTSTLPLFVYGMIRFEVTPAINAISTLMLLFSIVLVLFSLVLQQRR
jgi:spermidine/putrescine transport system permease protein